ncbi:MAG: trigger factor [Candidatus Omnitrophota bacterium]
MMKHHTKTLEGCARLLEIKADEKEIREIQENVIRDFEKSSRLPGFRPGKAPRELVRTHYEKQIREELLTRSVPELYDRAVGEAHLKPIGLPEISDVQFEGSKLSFKAKVEVEPDISLKKYKGLTASRKAVSVSSEEVQENLRSLREAQAVLSPKEGPAEENDFVLCDVEGSVDGKAIPPRKNVLLHCSFKDQKYPEVVKALLGANAGEIRETDLTLESPGGVIQKARYRVQIREVKKRKLPRNGR